MKLLHRLLPLLLVGGLGCHRGQAPQDANALATVSRARIFLISTEDKGPVGCGDTAVPVEAALPAPAPALWGSLESLLSARRSYEGQGLYNALASSPLRVRKIERAGSRVRVYLTGYLEIGGACDAPRVLAQLRETATQFPDVDEAEVFLNGEPLETLLSARG